MADKRSKKSGKVKNIIIIIETVILVVLLLALFGVITFRRPRYIRPELEDSNAPQSVIVIGTPVPNTTY